MSEDDAERGRGGPMWTVKDLAKDWRFSERTVRREIKAGRLQAVKLGPSARATRVPDWAKRRYDAERMG